VLLDRIGFVAVDGDARERDLENAMVDWTIGTLRDRGTASRSSVAILVTMQTGDESKVSVCNPRIEDLGNRPQRRRWLEAIWFGSPRRQP
jgi:hypothetical protein